MFNNNVRYKEILWPARDKDNKAVDSLGDQ